MNKNDQSFRLWVSVLSLFIFIECTDAPIPALNPPNAGVEANQMAGVEAGVANIEAGTEAGEMMGGHLNQQEGEVPNPFLPRPATQSCKLPLPPPAGEMTLTPASVHQFTNPLWYGVTPAYAQRVFLIEQGGKIWSWVKGSDVDPDLFLTLSVNRSGNEEGLLGMAFHPNFETEKSVFFYYSSQSCSSPQYSRCSILSRWQVDQDDPPKINPSSEVQLLEIPQPYPNHNGGDLQFGPDGYLYVSLGDGGSGGDPINHAQRPETLLGTILRIDIDQRDPQCNTEYKVPDDNPFSANRCGQMMGGLPEVWAWGLRNSWRISFDRETGSLWAADVGQNKWEEVNLIEGGKNYGWRPVEGPECFVNPCDLNAYEPPIHSYDHQIGESITGGFVYRGQEFPELIGYYIFADFESGKVMAFPLSDPSERVILAETAYRFSSFGEDLDGELVLLSFDAPSLLKLEQKADRQMPNNFPQLLSQTGCFSDIANGQFVESIVPYEVNIPFWSDYAEKERGFALPVNQKMQFREAGQGFDLPLNTVLLKSFYLTSVEGERKRFETRLIHNSEKGWVGYTYKWNEDQSDAQLLFTAQESDYDGPRGQQSWPFLKQGDCIKCHTAASNRALGFEVGQLNRKVSVEGGWYDQLSAWEEAGYIDLDQPSSSLPRFISADEAMDNELDLNTEARTYLHVNCAPCHRPDGVTTVELDLRFNTPLDEMKICNVPALQGDLGIDGGVLVAPGETGRSILLSRITVRGEDQMPPTGSNVIDLSGTALISLWISELTDCVP